MIRRRTALSAAALVALGLVAGACVAEPADDVPLERAELTTTTSTTAAPTTTTAVPTTTSTTAPPLDLAALRPPAAATDPAGLAVQIAGAEHTIRHPPSTGDEVAVAALAQQVAYRQLGRHPEWDDAVLAALPASLRRAVQLHVAARREFRAMHRTLSPTLPAWRIVRPDPHDQLLAAYREGEAQFGIPWQHLAAIHLVETATGRIRGTSTAGAQGPMQFMPATWAAYGGGGDINDTHDAILGAARYLAANNGASDIDGALYRYNHSDHYVRGVKLYAELIAAHPRSALALYHWGVWYLSDQGDVYLPVGYEELEPVPVAEYLARQR